MKVNRKSYSKQRKCLKLLEMAPWTACVTILFVAGRDLGRFWDSAAGDSRRQQQTAGDSRRNKREGRKNVNLYTVTCITVYCPPLRLE